MIKVIKPQPKFGITPASISRVTVSDYLHAVPSGKYQSDLNPTREPDIVKDDHASGIYEKMKIILMILG